MEGQILDAPPPDAKVKHNWDRMAALAKANPGKTVLAGKHVRDSLVKSVRKRNRPPFVTSEGEIIINLRNSTIEADGVRYGDVYFSWKPKEG
jgi:hypothetical protein